jgi:ATP-binding cassette subfamily G (WHITE) protein 2 (SNQ2)
VRRSFFAITAAVSFYLVWVCRRDRAGIQSRELGVLFKDLHVVGLGAAASYQRTFGSYFNPKDIVENFRTMRHPPLRDILSGFEGVVRPGEMLRP